MMRRWLKRVALAAGCLLVMVVIAGASVEAVPRHRATQDYPPPGRLVDIGRRRLQHASRYIQFERPDAVIGGVRAVVARVRGTHGTSPQ